MKWKSHADQLAGQVTHPISRWRPAVGAVPRHLFVPRWWERSGPSAFGVGAWTLRDGRTDTDAWIRATYADQDLVTRVGMLHADHASPDDQPTGLATARSTAPSVVVRMLRHARLTDDAAILAVSTGSGYACAVLCERSGYRQVCCLEPDEYLAKSAIDRLAGIGLHPRVMHGDLTEPLPGRYDRIVSGVAVRAVPASWLAALAPGGRLVTPIAGTTLILTADATPDGGAAGRTEWDRAALLPAETDPEFPVGWLQRFAALRDADGEQVSAGRYPVVDVASAGDLYSALGLAAPGLEHDYAEEPDGRRTAWMVHPDGSWARATAHGDDPPAVHQSGPRRLWDLLDDLRASWLRHGSLPVHGADATLTPDGAIHLRHAHWHTTLPASPVRSP
jgi:protein-L-isoaspartate O-methyltransferase